MQAAEPNGQPLERAWLTHDEVAGGGRLVLRLGPTPGAWGTRERPPNGLR